MYLPISLSAAIMYFSDLRLLRLRSRAGSILTSQGARLPLATLELTDCRRLQIMDNDIKDIKRCFQALI